MPEPDTAALCTNCGLFYGVRFVVGIRGWFCGACSAGFDRLGRLGR